MIGAIRCWLADRIFDLAWLVVPAAGSRIEIDEADLYPWGYGLMVSRAAMIAWRVPKVLEWSEITVSIGPALEVDHAGARWAYKGLLVGLGLAVMAWGAAWLLAALLSAIGLV